MESEDGKVYVVRVDRVEKHPNADRLDLAHVKGWQCVTQRGAFKDGELAIYIPIDSVLPPDLERRIFPEDSKVKLSKSRVKTIKLRGAISQGMLLSIFDASCLEGHGVSGLLEEGDDVTVMLGITHYEPPAAPASMRGNQMSPKKSNPFFPKYTHLSHFKNYPTLFKEGEVVVVTEKIHGTNFRAGWAPTYADTLWKKFKRLLKILPQYEFVLGSHNVQLKPNLINPYNGFYDSNVYENAARDYELRSKIPMGYILYGEVYGDGIQKGYTYGCGHEERHLRIFDVYKHGPDGSGRYIDWVEVEAFSKLVNVPTVPVVYRGPFREASVKAWEAGKSMVSSMQDHREGCVVKPMHESDSYMGRKILRSINPEYLLRSESDFH